MSVGDFPESLSQAILVGIILVGRLGVHNSLPFGSGARGGRKPYLADGIYDIYVYIYMILYVYIYIVVC